MTENALPKIIVASLAVLTLGASCPCLAQVPVSSVVVTARSKHPTDAPLREGMVGIEGAVLVEYFAACAVGPTPTAYLKLADALDRHANAINRSRVVSSSRAELSDLVARLQGSSTTLRGGEGQRAGVRQAIDVLVDYATDFRHPGRPALAHQPAVAASAEELSHGPWANDEVTAARAERRRLCKHLANGDFRWPWDRP